MVENDTMEYRSLGKSGIKVSALGFGTMTSGLGADTEEWAFACIDKCIRAGVNSIDTSEIYGNGIAETVLGKNLKTGGWDRDDLVISGKFFPALSMFGNSRKRLRIAMEKSLERMQLEYVDIAFLHRPDIEVPLEEQARTMNQFIEDDKAFYWGTSEFSPQQVMEIHQICEKNGLIHPIVEQCQYNMLCRENVETKLLPFFDDFGMGTAVSSPLCSGILSGRYNTGEWDETGRFATTQFPTYKQLWELFMVKNKDKTLNTLRDLATIASELGCTQAQLAVAWVLKSKDVSTCLLGASKPEQLDTTLGSVDVAKQLNSEVLERIEEILGNRPTPPLNYRYFKPIFPRR